MTATYGLTAWPLSWSSRGDLANLGGALTARLTFRIVKRARYEDPRLIDVSFAAFTAVAVFVNPWIWDTT
jgi:hypothetical protein